MTAEDCGWPAIGRDSREMKAADEANQAMDGPAGGGRRGLADERSGSAPLPVVSATGMRHSPRDYCLSCLSGGVVTMIRGDGDECAVMEVERRRRRRDDMDRSEGGWKGAG
jgi:hypothetical protein